MSNKMDKIEYDPGTIADLIHEDFQEWNEEASNLYNEAFECNTWKSS